MPSAPPTNAAARCEEDDGDEEELFLRRGAYAPAVMGAGGAVGGVAGEVAPSTVISSTCTSSWGGLVLDANAWHGGRCVGEVPGVMLSLTTFSAAAPAPPSALAAATAGLMPVAPPAPTLLPETLVVDGGLLAAVLLCAPAADSTACAAQSLCHMCGGNLTRPRRLSQDVITTFSAAAVL